MVLQIGTRRDGLYGYDRLDRLFGFLDRPSATRILPEFQHLAVGDKIPWGHDELTVSVFGTASRPRSEHGRSRYGVGVAVWP